MVDERERRRSWDLLPVLVLAAILLLGLLGWWVFPLVQHAVSNQDCVASGHDNCDR
jgi:antibiotic biosynthesis monooxygenase (ABM) superfamily enzyme